jgi:hypothetical protein
MGVRFNQISVDLSKMLNDEVGLATVNGKEFSANQRALAVNRAEANFISQAIAKMSIEEMAKNLKEMIRTYSSGIGSTPFASPPGSAKVIQCYSGGNFFIYVDVEKWDAVRLGYNPEETEAVYGTETVYRWTEFGDDAGNKVHVIPPVFSGIVTMRYLKDHVDLTPVSAEDLVVPARFDDDILNGAYQFITKLLQKT